MDQAVFAFAPDGGFIYESNTRRAWYNIPEAVAKLMPTDLKQINWATFGLNSNSYFLNYTSDNDRTVINYGPGVPTKLKSWLTDSSTGKVCRDKHTRVVFGPNEGFFAWDSSSIRWSNIPISLEETIQEWLSPAGWSWGPPRIIALGVGNAYFALSEYGHGAYSGIPSSMIKEYVAMRDLGSPGCDLMAVSLSSFAEHYVMLFRNSNYCFEVPTGRNPESFFSVIDSYVDDNTAKTRKEKREARRMEKARAEAEAKAKAERLAKLKKEDEEKCVRWYVEWKKQCDDDFKSTALRTTFRHPPLAVCSCMEASCVVRKHTEGSLQACKHDMERLLRGSGQYSLAWLRKERLVWHPDRYGQKCDSIFRAELVKKATGMYAIFEELLEEARKSGES